MADGNMKKNMKKTDAREVSASPVLKLTNLEPEKKF
jgi:hypothetical protein